MKKPLKFGTEQKKKDLEDNRQSTWGTYLRIEILENPIKKKMKDPIKEVN